MDVLDAQYKASHDRYEQLLAAADPTTIGELQRLNAELANILDKMLTLLHSKEADATNIGAVRDELNKKLAQIQSEYTVLSQDRDQFETLWLIRQHQLDVFQGAFYWYAIFLGIACVLFLGALLYNVRTSAAISTSPPTTSPLT